MILFLALNAEPVVWSIFSSKVKVYFTVEGAHLVPERVLLPEAILRLGNTVVEKK